MNTVPSIESPLVSVAAQAGGESYPVLVWRRFRKHRLAMAGGVILLLLLLTVLLAPFFAPNDPFLRDSDQVYAPPRALHFFDEQGFSLRPFAHPLVTTYDAVTFEPIITEDTSVRQPVAFFARGWDYSLLGLDFNTHLLQLQDGTPLYVLGTDSLGRDQFSRILFGGRLTLLLAALVVFNCVVIGTLVGITSGYFGGRTDMWIQRISELFLAFPELPLFLALIAVMPKTASPVMIFFLMTVILSALKWAQLAREVRGKSLSLARMDYVKAAIAVGATDRRVIIYHILPNVMSHVIVSASIMIPNFILVESFLSFLGVGIQPPLISLGQMLNAASDFQSVGAYPWLLSPVVFILLAVLAFNALGDGLRDAIDPYGN